MEEVLCPPHYWVIDPPDGPKSPGTCVRCGTTRDFVNWPLTPNEFNRSTVQLNYRFMGEYVRQEVLDLEY